jgi:hypothetical protein
MASVLCVSFLNNIFIFTIVGIAMVCGLDGSGSISGVARFFLLHGVQTGSGAHTASYPMDSGGYYPRG